MYYNIDGKWSPKDTREQMGARTFLKSFGMRAMGVMGTYEEPLTLSVLWTVLDVAVSIVKYPTRSSEANRDCSTQLRVLLCYYLISMVSINS